MDRYKTPSYKNKQRSLETRLFLAMTLLVTVAILVVIVKLMFGLLGDMNDLFTQPTEHNSQQNISTTS